MVRISRAVLSWVPRVLAGLPGLEPENETAVAADSESVELVAGARVVA